MCVWGGGGGGEGGGGGGGGEGGGRGGGEGGGEGGGGVSMWCIKNSNEKSYYFRKEEAKLSVFNLR